MSKEQNTAHTVARDGKRPLKFSGRLIGSGNNRAPSGERQNRWTEVDIYRTAGGQWVAVTTRRTQWQGEVDSTEAEAVDTVEKLLTFLEGDAGRLGGVSQEALDAAAKVDPDIAEGYAEYVR